MRAAARGDCAIAVMAKSPSAGQSKKHVEVFFGGVASHYADDKGLHGAWYRRSGSPIRTEFMRTIRFPSCGCFS